MKKVFKYPVESGSVINVYMPADAVALHFNRQGTQLCLWALVDPDRMTVQRQFKMVGTGHPLESCGSFINTILLDGGLVFHFFNA